MVTSKGSALKSTTAVNLPLRVCGTRHEAEHVKPHPYFSDVLNSGDALLYYWFCIVEAAWQPLWITRLEAASTLSEGRTAEANIQQPTRNAQFSSERQRRRSATCESGTESPHSKLLQRHGNWECYFAKYFATKHGLVTGNWQRQGQNGSRRRGCNISVLSVTSVVERESVAVAVTTLRRPL